MASSNAHTPVPSAWSESEVLSGLMTVDKAELIGQPLRLTAAYFRINARQVSIVELDGELVDGSTFTFTDSSTGVRKQIVEYLTAKGVTISDTSGEIHTLNLVAPEGLRVSEFIVTDDRTGKPVTAKTYYLTTNGQRVAAAPVTSARTARTGK